MNLSPLAEFTDALSGELYVSISSVKPVLHLFEISVLAVQDVVVSGQESLNAMFRVTYRVIWEAYVPKKRFVFYWCLFMLKLKLVQYTRFWYCTFLLSWFMCAIKKKKKFLLSVRKKSWQKIVTSILSKNILIHIFTWIVQPYLRHKRIWSVNRLYNAPAAESRYFTPLLTLCTL